MVRNVEQWIETLRGDMRMMCHRPGKYKKAMLICSIVN